MSSASRAMRLISRIVVVLAILLLSPAPSTGQYQLHTYVCQTQTFWCAIQYTPGVPDGNPCWCNTYWGPVTGRSIDPARVPNAPTLPNPQKQGPGQPPQGNPPQGNPGEVDSDDCYKGLGNCPGSFMKTAAGGGSRSRPGKDDDTGRRSSTPFGDALQRMIDGAGDDFDGIRAGFKRRSTTSSTYETTLVPSGLERCTVFVPHDSRRTPWMTCWPPDDLSATRLVRLVADALGKEGTRDGTKYVWQVGNVTVDVDRDDPINLTVRVR